MAIEKVRQYLKQWQADSRIREFDVSSATVELAAAALSCEPARIAKTLSFAVGDRCILIVTAGDARIDNQKFKETFGAKAKMLSQDEVYLRVGHEVGGVCPFAVNPDVAVYLDESLYRFEKVYPASGSSNSAIELTLPELENYSRYTGRVDVTKGWQV